MKKLGMFITDDEIRARYAHQLTTDAINGIMATLDADPATRAYDPYWNGARYRPAVEEALRVEHRSKAS